MRTTRVSQVGASQKGGAFNFNLSTLFTTFSAVMLGIVMGAGFIPAYAVDGDPPGLFELEGDPFDIVEALPDDWDMLYLLDPNNGGAGFGPQPIAFTGILADPAPTSIYWKGGSKDVLDIPNWWYKDGAVPDKDDITNAFAAGYTILDDVCLDINGDAILCSDGGAVTDPVHVAGDLVIYFGLDRYANNGDAFAGFWFLQDKVTMTGDQFDGEHVALSADGPGDLLALVEYPQASDAVPAIKIYQWDPMDYNGNGNLDSDGHSLGPLDLLITVANAECDGSGGKLACAISNLTEINGPDWPYTPKGGLPGDNYPWETFYEGGINVTRLLGGENICIATFLAETRSSRSETAQLKDFVLGGFDLCGSDVTTQIHDPDHTNITFGTVKAGTVIHDQATVTLHGPNLSLDPTGSVTFTLYDNNSCDGTNQLHILDVETVDIVDDSVPDATTIVEGGNHTLDAGKSYSFHAKFNSANPDFPDADLAECEVITIEKYPSMISTQIHQKDTGHTPDIQGETVYVGLTIHDHAYVVPDGTFTNPPTPTGNVVFTLFDEINCTGNTSVSTVALSGGNAISADNTPLGDTELSYSASYSGDANYLAATDVVCEPLDVDKYESKISTQIHDSNVTEPAADIQNSTVLVGLTVHDHAFVEEKTGTPSSPPTPTGSVTFKIYEGTSCAAPALSSFGGISWDQTGTLSSGAAITETFAPPGNTSFSISASYGGDANYRAATDPICEPLIVTKWTPGILTKVIVRDLAEVSGSAPGNPPTGSVKFETYRTANCTGTAVDTVTRPLSSGLVAEQELSSQQTLTVSEGVVSYKATYLGDDYYDPKVHDCELVQFSVLTP